MSEPYSAQVKAEAVEQVQAGLGVRATARLLGVHPTRVSEWTQGKGINRDQEAVRDLREQFNQQFVELTEARIDQALGAMPEKMDRANFAQLCTGVGILIDKRQLLLGRPTQIIETKHDVETIRAAFSAAFAESALAIGEFLQFCVDQAEMEGDHELAKLLPQIIEVTTISSE